MSVFHVQRIRSCVQCGEILSQKCDKCQAHPNRKPQIIELFDFPPVLATAECKCCIKLRCQREGCQNTFWRYIRLHYSVAKARSRNFYCSSTCAAKASPATKSTSIDTPCAYCGKIVAKQPAILKLRRHVFCNPSHHYLFVKKSRFDADKGKKIIEREMEKQALLQCGNGCKDITLHEEVGYTHTKHKCMKCGFVRSTTLIER